MLEITKEALKLDEETLYVIIFDQQELLQFY